MQSVDGLVQDKLREILGADWRRGTGSRSTRSMPRAKSSRARSRSSSAGSSGGAQEPAAQLPAASAARSASEAADDMVPMAERRPAPAVPTVIDPPVHAEFLQWAGVRSQIKKDLEMDPWLTKAAKYKSATEWVALAGEKGIRALPSGPKEVVVRRIFEEYWRRRGGDATAQSASQ